MGRFLVRMMVCGLIGMAVAVVLSTQIWRTGWSLGWQALAGLILGGIGVNGAMLIGMRWITSAKD